MEIKSLFQRITRNDDKKAFTIFYKKYHPKLLTFALRFLPSLQDAEDVVSEVMIKLLKQRKRLSTIANGEGYLYQAVKNQSLNHLKKNHQRHFLSFEVEEATQIASGIQPIHLLLEGELMACITQTVNAMPPQRKLIYNMIKNDGLKCKMVADLLEVSDKTVKKHLELAIRDLKKVIELYYEEPAPPQSASNTDRHIDKETASTVFK